MVSVAHAMGQGAAAQGAPQSGIAAFVPLIIMFVIFYFLLIRPQQKKAKEHREMISNLKKGDRIITSGGIYGTISSLDDLSATIEIAEKVKVKIVRGNIVSLANKENA